MYQHLRAIQVFQKSIAKSFALVRTFDEARHVGDDEAAVAAQGHDAEIRHERRERIIGDLRTAAEMREINVDFPAFGKSDQANVGEQLEVQLQRPGLTRHAFFESPWGAVRGADKSRVTAPADPALGNGGHVVRLQRDRRPALAARMDLRAFDR